jgi:hypothetical protein
VEQVTVVGIWLSIINNLGQVVGNSDLPDDKANHAFLWAALLLNVWPASLVAREK